MIGSATIGNPPSVSAAWRCRATQPCAGDVEADFGQLDIIEFSGLCEPSVVGQATQRFACAPHGSSSEPKPSSRVSGETGGTTTPNSSPGIAVMEWALPADCTVIMRWSSSSRTDPCSDIIGKHRRSAPVPSYWPTRDLHS